MRNSLAFRKMHRGLGKDESLKSVLVYRKLVESKGVFCLKGDCIYCHALGSGVDIAKLIDRMHSLVT